jgi:N-acetylglucosamine-6-phosphate deacetylase
VNGRVIGEDRVVDGAVGWSGSRLLGGRRRAPVGAQRIDVRGAYVAPGFVDLHAWGWPSAIASEQAAGGTTAFLTTAGPCAPAELRRWLADMASPPEHRGAACLGVHLEGPFLNPREAGALPPQWMRPPTPSELASWTTVARTIRMITLAPELPGAIAAVRWCARRGIVVSLGHTAADGAAARAAMSAGARAVTHLYNRMRPLHHRQSSLLDVALTEPGLTAMVIADGVHISDAALRIAYRCKGADGMILVTDAVRYADLRAEPSRGAMYQANGTLAGSTLTMIRAVHNVVASGTIPLWDAVRMASRTPARLLGDERRGHLEAGCRADLVVFDERFRVRMTVVGGRIVFPAAAPRTTRAAHTTTHLTR